MARPRSSKPSYCRDRATERAYVVIDGQRHWLGPRGTYGSQPTRDRYDQLIGEWIARGRAPGVDAEPAGGGLTVADVCLAFWEHAVHTYPAPPVPAKKRPEGELGNFWDALRPLVRLYGQTPAAEFGPVKLAAVRDEMVRLGWCRNFANRNVSRLKHVFKWAVGVELLRGEVWHRLAALPGLRK
jgi:hypothetical protein